LARTALTNFGRDLPRRPQLPELEHCLLQVVHRHRQTERGLHLSTVGGTRDDPVRARRDLLEGHPEVVAIVGRHLLPDLLLQSSSQRS
jgi:hypothetical protein